MQRSIKDLLNISEKNRDFFKLTEDDEYWRKAFAKHFSHRYKYLTKKNNINWRDLFIKTFNQIYNYAYYDHYQTKTCLSPEQKELLYLINEEDLENLKEKIRLTDLLAHDGDYNLIIDVAAKKHNQALLDAIFQVAMDNYTQNGKIQHQLVINELTILDWAIWCNQVEFVKTWTSNKINLNRATVFNFKKTPLLIAVDNEFFDMVKILIASGANCNEITIHNHFPPPLMVAAKTGNLEIMKYLINHGASVQAIDRTSHTTINTEMTAIDIAAKNNDLEMVKYLLEEMNKNNKTKLMLAHKALWFAAKFGYMDMVKYLLEHHVNLETKHDSVSPLWIATEHNQVDVVRYLIEHGARVNCQNEENKSAIWIAAEQGYVEIAKLLLEKGADIKQANIIKCEQPDYYYGKPCYYMDQLPIKVAQDNKHDEIVKLLNVLSVGNEMWRPAISILLKAVNSDAKFNIKDLINTVLSKAETILIETSNPQNDYPQKAKIIHELASLIKKEANKPLLEVINEWKNAKNPENPVKTDLQILKHRNNFFLNCAASVSNFFGRSDFSSDAEIFINYLTDFISAYEKNTTPRIDWFFSEKNQPMLQTHISSAMNKSVNRV